MFSGEILVLPRQIGKISDQPFLDGPRHPLNLNTGGQESLEMKKALDVHNITKWTFL